MLKINGATGLRIGYDKINSQNQRMKEGIYYGQYTLRPLQISCSLLATFFFRVYDGQRNLTVLEWMRCFLINC